MMVSRGSHRRALGGGGDGGYRTPVRSTDRHTSLQAWSVQGSRSRVWERTNSRDQSLPAVVPPRRQRRDLDPSVTALPWSGSNRGEPARQVRLRRRTGRRPERGTPKRSRCGPWKRRWQLSCCRSGFTSGFGTLGLRCDGTIVVDADSSPYSTSRPRRNRWVWRMMSRSLSVSRLSWTFLPRQSANDTLMRRATG